MAGLSGEVEATLTAHRRRLEEFAVSLSTVESPADLLALRDKHPARETADDLLKLAGESDDPEQTRSALLAALMVGQSIVSDEEEGRVIAAAGEALMRDYAEDPELRVIPLMLGGSSRPEAHDLLRDLRAASPFRPSPTRRSTPHPRAIPLPRPRGWCLRLSTAGHPRPRRRARTASPSSWARIARGGWVDC